MTEDTQGTAYIARGIREQFEVQGYPNLKFFQGRNPTPTTDDACFVVEDKVEVEADDSLNPYGNENPSEQSDDGVEPAGESGDCGHGGIFQSMNPLGDAEEALSEDGVNPDTEDGPSDVGQSDVGAKGKTAMGGCFRN